MVTLLFFGELKDLAVPTAGIDFNGTVGQLRMHIEEVYPNIKNKTFSVAVNKIMASDDTMITASAEVAIMPPFSGG